MTGYCEKCGNTLCNCPAPECPEYRKVPHDDGWATQLYMIVCNEGWRESIVCERMYEWAADWLLGIVQGKPYAEERRGRGVRDWLRIKRLLGASHTLSMVDPIGWDEEAKRVHDCELQPNGRLLHFSTCWCRAKGADDAP